MNNFNNVSKRAEPLKDPRQVLAIIDRTARSHVERGMTKAAAAVQVMEDAPELYATYKRLHAQRAFRVLSGLENA